MIALLAYAAVALAVSFVCAVLAAVWQGLSSACVASLEPQGRVRELLDHRDRPQVALRLLKTLVDGTGIAAVAMQGMQVIAEPLLVIAAVAVLLLFLQVAAIVPEALGARWQRRLAPRVIVCLSGLVTLLLPLIWLLEALGQRLMPERRNTPYLRDEIRAMAELGAKEGVLQGQESELMKNMLRFRDLKIAEIMTPRSVLFALPEAMDTSTYLRHHADSAFSRIPVYGQEPDDINGFVMKMDILSANNRAGQPVTLAELKRPIIVVLENEPLPRLMTTLLEKRSHIAMVVTEYGDIRGVVTLEDMIETLLGREIVDESDKAVDMQQVARQKWADRLSTPRSSAAA